MSARHPSSRSRLVGAGTTTVMRTSSTSSAARASAAFVEGGLVPRHDRKSDARGDEAPVRRRQPQLQPLRRRRQPARRARGAFPRLRRDGYGQGAQVPQTTRGGRAVPSRSPARSRPGPDLPEGSDLLFYEPARSPRRPMAVDVGRHADLLVGVVPIINLEWIQKLHRGQGDRRATRRKRSSTRSCAACRLRELHRAAVRPHARHFQRVPIVATSNPSSPATSTVDESILVIRFANPRAIDFRTCCRCCRLVHVAPEHARRARRQDAARDAADLHADDPALMDISAARPTACAPPPSPDRPPTASSRPASTP